MTRSSGHSQEPHSEATRESERHAPDDVFRLIDFLETPGGLQRQPVVNTIDPTGKVRQAAGCNRASQELQFTRDALILSPFGFAQLLSQARDLDLHYIPSRYTNGLPSGYPHKFYGRETAERALIMAEKIFSAVRDHFAENEERGILEEE